MERTRSAAKTVEALITKNPKFERRDLLKIVLTTGALLLLEPPKLLRATNIWESDQAQPSKPALQSNFTDITAEKANDWILTRESVYKLVEGDADVPSIERDSLMRIRKRELKKIGLKNFSEEAKAVYGATDRWGRTFYFATDKETRGVSRIEMGTYYHKGKEKFGARITALTDKDVRIAPGFLLASPSASMVGVLCNSERTLTIFDFDDKSIRSVRLPAGIPQNLTNIRFVGKELVGEESDQHTYFLLTAENLNKIYAYDLKNRTWHDFDKLQPGTKPQHPPPSWYPGP